MPATVRLRPSLLGIACCSVLMAASPAGCKGRGTATASPEPAPDDRGEDAAALPAFDAPASTPAEDDAAVPYERFYVRIGDAPVRGPADAPVTIVMFSDFECPFCRRGYETLERLRARYGDELRIAYKAFPLDFHEHALAAAAAAESAREAGRFWPFFDAMFRQPEVTDETILTAAQQAGLDPEKVRADIEARRGVARVARNLRQGRTLGVSSTPTFFVNGRLVKGAQPFEDFVTLVEQERALAERWRRAGVPADGIYAHAIADGYRKVTYRKRRGPDPDGVYPVPLGDAPVLGEPTAPVTVVIFGDFECPFCAVAHEVLAELSRTYGDRLRIAYKHFPLPFHRHAILAARGAVFAQARGKFWPYYDAVYARRADLSVDALVAVAKEVGLPVAAFRKAIYDDGRDARILADVRQGMELGVTGTPAFFVNGRPIVGAQPAAAFVLVIEEELERARALAAEGVPPERLYEELTHRPLDPPEADEGTDGGP